MLSFFYFLFSVIVSWCFHTRHEILLHFKARALLFNLEKQKKNRAVTLVPVEGFGRKKSYLLLNKVGATTTIIQHCCVIHTTTRCFGRCSHLLTQGSSMLSSMAILPKRKQQLDSSSQGEWSYADLLLLLLLLLHTTQLASSNTTLSQQLVHFNPPISKQTDCWLGYNV